MATTEQIALLRLAIADPSTAGDGSDSFFSDDELAAYLDAVDGSEPRARVPALRAMVAEAAKAVDFTEGDYAEKAQQYFKNLSDLLAAAEAEVTALDEQDAALTRVRAAFPTRIPVQWVF
jgi:hypothetical protein